MGKDNLPTQLVLPSPVKPDLQAHWNEPGVFVQLASTWHKPRAHSLISRKRQFNYQSNNQKV